MRDWFCAGDWAPQLAQGQWEWPARIAAKPQVRRDRQHSEKPEQSRIRLGCSKKWSSLISEQALTMGRIIRFSTPRAHRIVISIPGCRGARDCVFCFA